MDPNNASTNSGSIRRKRNTVETGFLRTDDERATKRSRAPSQADDYARPIRQALHFNDMSTPPSYHQTQQSDAHNTHTSQRRSQPSTQRPKNDNTRLGTSLFDRQPFLEESDSDEERETKDPVSLFVHSDESDRSSQSRYEGNNEKDTRVPYQEDEDMDSRYSDNVSPIPKYSSATLQQPQGPQHQGQPAPTSRLRVRVNLQNASGRQNPASQRQPPQHGRADGSGIPARKTAPIDQKQRREIPSQSMPRGDGQAQPQAEAQEQDRATVRARPREDAHGPSLRRTHISHHSPEATQSWLRREARVRDIPSQAHPTREYNRAPVKQHNHGPFVHQTHDPQDYRDEARSSPSEDARERAIPSQTYLPREHSQAKTQERANGPRSHRIRDAQHNSEVTQTSPREVSRERAINSQAQPSREQKRALIDTRSHADNTEVTEQTLNESYPLQRPEKRARILVPQHEDHRSPTSASASPLATGKPKPLPEYRRVDSILDAVNTSRSHSQKKTRPRFQQDIDYPSDAESFTSPAPSAPRPLQQSRPAVFDSADASSPKALEGWSKQQLLDFNPDDLDRKVRAWLHPGPDAIDPEPISWDDVTELLDMYHSGYILESVKFRQRMYAAKLDMGPERVPAGESQVRTQPMSNETIRSHQKSLEKERNNISQPLSPAVPVIPAVAVALPPSKLPDVTRLADTLEKERLERQTREHQLQQREQVLQQRIRTLEEESLANALKLQAQENERKLKAEVEGKYQKLKEEAQTQQERLKDEHAARTRAERELKQAQSEANRIRLAQAGSTRKGARAEGAGFVFPKDNDPDTDKTPSRSKSRKGKRDDNVEIREDGHPRTAGKSLPPASIQALYKHMNDSIAEEENIQMAPEMLQEPDLTYFVYTVHRKHWPRDTTEPEEDEGMICGQYCYLNQANAEVTNEILRPHGSDGIAIDPLQDRSLHQGVANFNMAWARLDVRAGHVKVWVQRQLHTEFTGELPVFEARGLLSRTVFAICQKITTTTAPTLATSFASSRTTDAASPTTSAPLITTTTTTSEDPEIYTTFDLANLKASEKLFLVVHGPLESQSPRYDAIKRRQAADTVRKQALEDLEGRGELFDGEVNKRAERNGDKKIRIWVVEKTVVGPRN